MTNIHFIGAGHLAKALLKGLCSQKGYALSVSSPTILKKTMPEGVSIHTSNTHFLSTADLIIIAVKPETVVTVCKEIAPLIKDKQIIISLAAGTKLETLQSFFTSTQPVARAMPNIAAEFNESATALYAGTLSEHDHQRIELLFNTLGESAWVASDNHIDIATALAGSSPAFFYQFVGALIQGAIQAGLPKDIADKLGAQAMYGANTVAKNVAHTYEELKEQVKSKKGTTEAGLNYLSTHQLNDIVTGALTASITRAQALSKNK
jgi:pyrroline-5-carboxylate reductase